MEGGGWGGRGRSAAPGEGPVTGRRPWRDSAHPHQAGVPGPLLSVLERLPVTSTVSPARAFRPELYPTDGSRQEL